MKANSKDKDILECKYKNISEYARLKKKLLLGEKTVNVKNLPIEVSIEVSKRCNIQCRMCTQPLILKDTVKSHGSNHLDFDIEMYQKFNHILYNATFFYLVGIGEPFINRHFLQILRASSQHRLYSWVYTNGLLLTPEKMKEIIFSELTRVTFSISAGSDQKYSEIHKGGEFKQVMENIAAFAEIKDDLKVSHPELTINFVAMKDNVHELPLLIKRLPPHSIGTLEIKPEARITDGSYHNNLNEINPAIIKETEQLALDAGIIVYWYHYDVSQSRQRPLHELGICMQPFRTLHINTLGNVYPCCAGETLGRDSLIMGNLYEQSIEEIWNGDRFQILRKRLIERDYLPACKECIKCSLNYMTTDQFDDCANFADSIEKVGKYSTYIEKEASYDEKN